MTLNDLDLNDLNDLDLNDLNDLNAPASSAENRSSMKTKAGLK